MDPFERGMSAAEAAVAPKMSRAQAEQEADWSAIREQKRLKKRGLTSQIAPDVAASRREEDIAARMRSDYMTQRHNEALAAQRRNEAAQAQDERVAAEQDRKWGLIPGTTKGFHTFAKGFNKAATTVADLAVNYTPIGATPLAMAYRAFAPPGSSYYKENVGDKFKSLATDVGKRVVGAVGGPVATTAMKRLGLGKVTERKYARARVGGARFGSKETDFGHLRQRLGQVKQERGGGYSFNPAAHAAKQTKMTKQQLAKYGATLAPSRYK